MRRTVFFCTDPWHLLADLVERCPVRIVARYVSLWGPNVYLYLWSHAITAVTWTTIPELSVALDYPSSHTL